MTRWLSQTSVTTAGLLALLLIAIPLSTTAAPKDETLGSYFKGCLGKSAKDGNCDKLRKEAVEILKEDLLTLGSTADRAHLPLIVETFRSGEIELRLAAAHAIGMIGPQDQDVDAIIPLTNDPVPDVRHAVSSMLSQGKSPAISLLKQRMLPMRTGRISEMPADPGKYSMPVAPDSVYLFDSSDATGGRLSYVARGKSDPGQFYKAKAKKGPFPLQEFKDKYRYQFQDEDEAMQLAREMEGKEIENTPPPDPSNLQAYTEFMQKIASVGAKQGGRMYLDSYEPKLFGAPTVYVLEERQIGKRSYPTRYAVVYQELALKRPGYRLAWMTVSDNAIKTAQAASLEQEKEEMANQAERETVKKKQAELDALTKKKDAVQKKQFKKGQEDLEKELGF
ncbi:MAG: HEAT repeat domain-containing protein [Nitrospira sp. LK70]|nr:HEAT repeat domain-containing protein [Nitrospira sp. LK70]